MISATPAEIAEIERLRLKMPMHLRALRRLSYVDRVVAAGDTFMCDVATARDWIATGAAEVVPRKGKR